MLEKGFSVMAMRKTTTKKTATAKPAKPTVRKTSAGNGSPAKSKPALTLSYDQISKKAYEIWLSKGCPQGQDEANWKEAEAALMKRA